MNIVLIGQPASGKGTQAEKLVEKYGLANVEMGGILRKISKEDSDLGRQIKSIIEEGKLVPDQMTIEILIKHLENLNRLDGIIFDGFPRVITQAEAFEKYLAEKGKKIDLAIYLDLPREEVFKRLVNRRLCEKCGKTFNLLTKPSRAGDLCDSCGGKLVVRTDETPEKVNVRLDLFEQQTRPVIEYFAQKGILEKVDGNRSIEDIFAEIALRISRRNLV